MDIAGRVAATLGLFLLAVTTLGGCYWTPVIPPSGGVFTSIEAPLDIDYANTDLGSKRGEAHTTAILGMIAWGDASTQAAAGDGGISTIQHADYEYFNVLGVYQKFTVKVYGE